MWSGFCGWGGGNAERAKRMERKKDIIKPFSAPRPTLGIHGVRYREGRRDKEGRSPLGKTIGGLVDPKHPYCKYAKTGLPYRG